VKPKKLYILVAFLIAIVLPGNAQLLETKQKNRPDSLTLADRISLRTNTLDWLLLLPNISAEYDLGCYDYNHWAVGMGFRYNWQTKHHFKPAQVYNLAEVRGEVRYYWHTQKIDTTYNINPHDRIIDKGDTIIKKKDYWGRLWSTRRFMPKHLNTTYYRGAYVAYDKYSLLLGKTGRQGKAIQAGFLYGVVKPLYEFKNGNTLDLDLGVSAGLCFASYDKYYNDRESDCYPVTGHQDWSIVPFPVINELRFSFIYRFGEYPLTRKYRWRIDVDAAYREEQQMIADSLRQKRTEQLIMTGEMKALRKLFDQYYQQVEQDVKIEVEKQAEAEAKKAKQDKQAEQAKKTEESKAAKADKSKKEKTPKVEKAKKEKTPKEEKPKKEKKSKKDKKKESAEETPVTSESSDNQETPATQDSTDNKETQETPEQPQKEKTPENED